MKNTETAVNTEIAETPPAKPQGKYGPVSAFLITILAFFGSQFLAFLALFSVVAIAALPVLGFAAITGEDAENNQALRSIEKLLQDSTPYQLVYILMAELFTLLILYLFINSRKISLKDIGLGRWPKFSDLGFAIIFAIGYFISTLIVLGFVDNFIPSINVEQEQNIGFESASGLLQLSLVFIVLAVLVPVVEEITVRGFLYTGLRQKMTRITAALVASFLFGIAHLQLYSGEPPLYVVAIDTFILSLFLIALRLKTGSLWSGIIVHGFKNGLAFFALFVFHVS